MKMAQALALTAKYQGCSLQTLKEGLKQGAIKYGTAFIQDGSKSYTYLLYPEDVKRHLGLNLGKHPFVQVEDSAFEEASQLLGIE